MPTVENIERVKRAIAQSAMRYFDSPDAVKNESVVVGYTAAYALYVHEDLEKTHGAEYNEKHAEEIAAGAPDRGEQQQAKFLERPAREFAAEIGGIITRSCKAGQTLQTAIYQGALRLQRESQKIVPVDTGNLRGSAFTQKE
jgi:hypothetical protein